MSWEGLGGTRGDWVGPEGTGWDRAGPAFTHALLCFMKSLVGVEGHCVSVHLSVRMFDLFLSQILGLMLVRKLLDVLFSQHDLAWLDDLLPGKEDKKKKDERKRDGGKKEKKKVRGGDESEDEVRQWF